jgi:chromate transport protein ChrA
MTLSKPLSNDNSLLRLAHTLYLGTAVIILIATLIYMWVGETKAFDYLFSSVITVAVLLMIDHLEIRLQSPTISVWVWLGLRIAIIEGLSFVLNDGLMITALYLSLPIYIYLYWGKLPSDITAAIMTVLYFVRLVLYYTNCQDSDFPIAFTDSLFYVIILILTQAIIYYFNREQNQRHEVERLLNDVVQTQPQPTKPIMYST